MNTQSSVDTRIKVGIIGFGRMGRFYWEAMTKSGRWNIAYICDTDPESRQLAKKLSPESLIVEDNQKVFEDESVQVVGLFTLADSRMEQIEKLFATASTLFQKNLLQIPWKMSGRSWK